MSATGHRCSPVGDGSPALRLPAFTLVEMLVSILVVSLLMGILLPALASVRDSGRRTACLAQLRGFGASITMYRDANNGVLPYADQVYDLTRGWTAPWAALGPYIDAPLPRLGAGGEVNTSRPFTCPLDTTHAPRYGISYSYVPAAYMQTVSSPSSARWVTQLYERTPSLPVLQDWDNWHARGRSVQDRNVLHLDGSASTYQP